MSSLRHLRLPLFCLLGSALLTSTTIANDCRFLLPKQPSNAEALAPPGDRELYVLTRNGWSKVTTLNLDLPRQTFEFAYVIRDDASEARRGVLLIKSGRNKLPDEQSMTRRSKKVRLSRSKGNVDDNTPCGPIADFADLSVSAQSYDDFHDRGLAVADGKTLEKFHINYAARRNNCRRTDNDAIDSIVPLDLRSNRGQFSFDRSVVNFGTYSQVLAWFKPTSAFASSDELADQRVEMRQYRTIADTPVCIRFNVSVRGPATFLRINDLEARLIDNLRFLRAAEQEWTLSQ